MEEFRNFSMDLMRYGEYLEDKNLETKEGIFVRITIIKYENNLWYHEMRNGFTTKISRL